MGRTMLVDQKAAIEELGITDADYQEFLGDLLNYVREVLPQMAPVLSGTMSRDEMQHLAHSLKGACRNMRFIAAGDIAYQLEKWGAGQCELDAASTYRELQATLMRSFAEFGMQADL